MRTTFLVVSILFTMVGWAQDSQFGFVEDTRVATDAKKAAESFVELVKKHYDFTLNYTDASIEKVEFVADDIYKSWSGRKVSEQAIQNLAYIMGSYVGETYRRNHSAQWGITTYEGRKYSAMRGEAGLFWPTGRAENRIRNGFEDNVWHYYQYLLRPKDASANKPLNAIAPKNGAPH